MLIAFLALMLEVCAEAERGRCFMKHDSDKDKHAQTFRLAKRFNYNTILRLANKELLTVIGSAKCRTICQRVDSKADRSNENSVCLFAMLLLDRLGLHWNLFCACRGIFLLIFIA